MRFNGDLPRQRRRPRPGSLSPAGGRPGAWRTTSLDRLLECSLSRPEGLGRSILIARDVTEAVSAEARLREATLVGPPDLIAAAVRDMAERAGVEFEFVARSYFATMEYDRQVELMQRLASEIAPHL